LTLCIMNCSVLCPQTSVCLVRLSNKHLKVFKGW
jgi:hypothetical protein